MNATFLNDDTSSTNSTIKDTITTNITNSNNCTNNDSIFENTTVNQSSDNNIINNLKYKHNPLLSYYHKYLLDNSIIDNQSNTIINNNIQKHPIWKQL